MISRLDIKGFKSIKKIHLDCRRINLFIGEPNTGKSNILEALGFLSWCGCGGLLHEYVRLMQARDLFYDGIATPGNWEIALTKDAAKSTVQASYNNGAYRFNSDKRQGFFSMGSGRGWPNAVNPRQSQFGFIRYYRFQPMPNYSSEETSFLLPPKGDNIVALLYSSKDMRRLAGDYFAPSGLIFVVKPHEHEIEIQKQSEGVAVGFPYPTASDTLQRMVFYMAAIESNKNATLIFEEPEAHAFPYYVKHLAERIALEENNNQYFIATHNPYFLTAIWEKSREEGIAVFATYYRDYETKVKLLTPDDRSSLFEGDPFAGVSHLVEDAP